MAIHTAYTSGSGAIPTITCVEDTDIWIPVLLVDKTDGITGETGIAYGSVDVDYGLASATSLTSYTVTTNDWKEMGEGLYALNIGAGEFSSAGRYIIRVVDSGATALKYACVAEVYTASQDDLVRSTTPANTLDVDSNGLVDVSKFNGTAAVVENSLLSVNIASISEDNTAADTLESVLEGGTTLSVDATKISGDTAAADALELFVETLSSGQLQTGSFAGNTFTEALFADNFLTNAQIDTTALAEIADAIWDEATSGHTSSGTFGEQLKTDVDAILTATGSNANGVKLDLTQGMGETHDALTVGYALYVMYAHFVHKWTTSGGNSVVHKADGSTFQSRTIHATDHIGKKS